MNFKCDQVAELLPWYLNGTLDKGVQEEVRVHLEGCTECRRALEETCLAWRIFDQHIPSEALVALAWGETPEGLDRDILDRHLETCPECAAELELVRTGRRLEEDDRIALFPTSARREKAARPAPAWRTAAMAAGLAGIVAASGWLWTAGRANDLEARLAEASRPVETAPMAEMSAEVERLKQYQADLLRKQQEMQQQLAQIAGARPAAAPQINAWIGGLQPAQEVVRGGAGAAEELPAGRPLSLALGSKHKETHRGHRIEIVDSAGEVVWSADGLVPDAGMKAFGITLPAGALKPGEYTIRLSAQEEGRKVNLESYAIKVK